MGKILLRIVERKKKSSHKNKKKITSTPTLSGSPGGTWKKMKMKKIEKLWKFEKNWKNLKIWKTLKNLEKSWKNLKKMKTFETPWKSRDFPSNSSLLYFT